MSVVIKGMIKPKDCGYCQFCIEEDVMFETEFRCSITGIYMDEDHCFPDICPIVELPEHHGRLIDMDELKADYGMKDDCTDCDKEERRKSVKCEFDRSYTKMNFCGWLDDAPVVVEAEGAEE